MIVEAGSFVGLDPRCIHPAAAQAWLEVCGGNHPIQSLPFSQASPESPRNLFMKRRLAYCKVFRTTLSKCALAWFNQLPVGTISSLEQLTQRFLHRFSMNKRAPKMAAFLFTIRQKENEPFRDYMQRFMKAVHEVPHVNHELLASIIQQNLLLGRFNESIAGKPPSTMEDLLMRSQKYIRIEESNVSDTSLSVKRKGRVGERAEEGRTQTLNSEGIHALHPLNALRGEILVVAEQQGLINQWPRKMQDNPKRLKSDKYCRFYRDMGHTTEKCHHLQNKIEKLIQRGHLKEYIKHYPQGLQFAGGPSAPPRELTLNPTPRDDNFPTPRVIP
ncbi:UNVERIFIED_CONTAM: hypothetical protein Slati_1306400 [Sesamum latifolium]|uniref:Retrotransposon gag domain-containing protein n=1 Tax=Sesamum latifolium TaxID=2727402 RepID=A0AAW2XH49_9LAMI